MNRFVKPHSNGEEKNIIKKFLEMNSPTIKSFNTKRKLNLDPIKKKKEKSRSKN